MKKVFSGAKETHHDFLHGGHGESYQLKKCKKKVVGQIFAFITWAKWELCIHKVNFRNSFEFLKNCQRIPEPSAKSHLENLKNTKSMKVFF